ncbi:Ig-like domain-containing protein [Paeniglutamicibacter sp. MACA_103]|uniref:Ig-like domain-containing protein n=1 Tax=Paeniglutamicibacter sp. MACA_103 TaxID=3377337 RepID=UPI003893B8DA
MKFLRRSAKRKFVAGVSILSLALLTAGSLVYAQATRGAEIVSHFPRDGAESVSRAAAVVAWLDRPITNQHSELDLLLSDQRGLSVDGELELGADRRSIIFNPSSALEPGKYVASVRDKDPTTSESTDLTTWSFIVPDNAPIAEGPGGSILLILNETHEFSANYSEILRVEGLSTFETISLGEVTPTILKSHELAILSAGSVEADKEEMIAHWVENEHGNLVAINPKGRIAELAGVTNLGPGVSDGYVHIDTAQAPGKGIVAEPIQFHGESVTLGMDSGTRAIGSLQETANDPGGPPAITLKPGNDVHGSVAAYAFSLAKSTALTRQGNPDWAGQERDGIAPIRPNDLFFDSDGNDYLDLSKAHIPQADEQMRLFSNLIGYMNQGNGPMPKFWYFPKFSKAILVMASDDHGTPNGTATAFAKLDELSPDGCSVVHWECFRATSWLYPNSGLSPAAAKDYSDRGFDVGAHVTTGCKDWDAKSLVLAFSQSLGEFRAKYRDLPPQTGNRMHCIAWSEWSSQATAERSWGMRMDMNYYYWPGDWVRERAGFMTGSGLPMRFSNTTGRLINVYQQETHLVDEVFASNPRAVERLLARATGPEGFYGAFGTHYDFSNDFAVELMDIAIRHSIPMVSAKQLLEWTDARNGSSFTKTDWNHGELSFELDIDPGTHGMLRTMLPTDSMDGTLARIQTKGADIDFVVETVKGVEYAVFDAASGSFVATYK